MFVTHRAGMFDPRPVARVISGKIERGMTRRKLGTIEPATAQNLAIAGNFKGCFSY